MAKKSSLKSGLTSGGLPTYRKTNYSTSGGNALESDHYVARDSRKPLPGVNNARHLIINPSGASGSVGSGQPLRTNRGGKEMLTSDNPILRTTKVARPKK
jgi:hypothetical protein